MRFRIHHKRVSPDGVLNSYIRICALAHKGHDGESVEELKAANVKALSDLLKDTGAKVELEDFDEVV